MSPRRRRDRAKSINGFLPLWTVSSHVEWPRIQMIATAALQRWDVPRNGHSGPAPRSQRRTRIPIWRRGSRNCRETLTPANSDHRTQTGPTATVEQPADRQSLVPLMIIGLIAALVLGALGVVIGMLASNRSAPDPTAATVAAQPAPTIVQTVTAPPSKPAPTATAAARPSTTTRWLPPPINATPASAPTYSSRTAVACSRRR